MKEKLLIVGLGNPGKQYINNRHNIGFKVVEELAKRLQLKFRYSIKLQSQFTKTKYENKDIFLALPQTFMNNSGNSVWRIIKNKKILLKDVLIICDDLDLDFGSLRIRPKGTDAGHRGMRSIIQATGTGDFSRMKIGIGRAENNRDAASYVLSNFNSEQKKELPLIINKAVEVCFCWIKEGVDTAMSKFNSNEVETYGMK